MTDHDDAVCLHFSGLDISLKDKLSSRLNYVLSHLSENSKLTSDLVSKFEKYSLNYNQSPDFCLDMNQLKGKKGSHPIAFLLSMSPINQHANYQRCWALVIAASFLIKQDIAFIGVAYRACRLLYKAWGDVDFQKEIPSLPANINTSHQILKEFIADHYSNSSELTSYLRSVRILFEKYKNNKAPTTRNKSSQIIQTEEIIDPEFIGAKVIKNYKPTSISSSGVNGLELEAERSEDEVVIQHAKLRKEDRKSRNVELLKTHNSKASQKIILNKMSLWSSWNTMTANEIRTVFLYCHEKFRDVVGHDKWGYFALILSILTGRHPFHLLDLKKKTKFKKGYGDYWYESSNIIYLAFKPNIARIKIAPTDLAKEEYFNLVRNSESLPMLLPIPKIFQEPLLEFVKCSKGLKRSIFEENLKRIVSELNQLPPHRFSVGRISKYMKDTLLRQGTDEVIGNWLSGLSASNAPDMHYSQFSSQYANQIYMNYIKGIVGSDLLFPSNLLDENIGSMLVPADNDISLLFRIHFKRLNELANPDGIDSWINFHNLYTYYLYELLALSTGYRPVLKPFGSVEDIDFFGGFIFIQDKDNEDKPTPRFVPLANIVVLQIQEYLKHLEKFAFVLAPFFQKLSNKIHDKINGRGCYLFVVSKDKLLLDLDPKNLDFYRYNIWPFPLNWQRHYLLTKMLGHDIPCEVKRGFAGHALYSKNFYGPLSGSSIQDISLLRPFLNTLLEELKIEVFECQER